MGWTPNQEQSIKKKDADILVSAAAGSGKTTVLVERIIEKVTDSVHPVDIDRFLVVTFTKAAAAQMRDKIAARLEKALMEHPESEHLAKQLVLVRKADITTIDSFCLSVVKENFSLLEIDSDYTIGDNGMLELLMIDAMDRLFEEEYASEDGEAFRKVTENYGGDREDEDLRRLIRDIYNTADGFSEPMLWYERAEEAQRIETEEELEKQSWVAAYEAYVRKIARDGLRMLEEIEAWMDDPDGPVHNLPLAASDREKLERFASAGTLREIAALRDEQWMRVKPVPKGSEFTKEDQELFKNKRNAYKNLFDKKKLPAASPTEILEQIAFMRDDMLTLLRLAKRFGELFDEEKKKRKLMSFSDVEHLAYRLLCSGHADGSDAPIPTDVAKEIAKRYEEIYIDEYQDSNFLQEDILRALSGELDGLHRMYMVGDVKQSIYRFRRARPDLFLAKYNAYAADGDQVKIELAENFRSREQVLASVNHFFYHLMGKELGGIEYNEDVALKLGAPVPEVEGMSDSYTTELMILDRNLGREDEDDTEDEEKLEVEKLQAEASMVALRILELTNPEQPQMVYDRDAGTFRPANYGDIVILTRGLKNVGGVFMNTLKNYDIPVVLDRGEGYFEATEIRVLMSMLAVIDNTRQDIPMAAVLLSPIAGLDEEELAAIRKNREEQKTKTLWESAELYALSNEDAIAAKVERFGKMLDMLREDKTGLSITDLIYKVLAVTGYMDYVSAMPQGAARTANIRLLIEKAKQYEQGIYKGLFDFLRYLEKLKFTGGDMGADGGVEEAGDAVRIMTMHGSKGLEFPIVFVSALGKLFNRMDTRPTVIVSSDYYLAGMLMYTDKRYKKDSVLRNCFKILFREESLAEELRILYVAMTRAKEKLILTGCMDDCIEKKKKYEGETLSKEEKLPFSLRYDAPNFLTLLVATMERSKDAPVNEHIYGILDIEEQEVSLEAKEEPITSALLSGGLAGEAKVLYDRFRDELSYVYPYTEASTRSGKLSVSEIKRMKEFDGETYEVAERSYLEAEADQEEKPSVEQPGASSGASPGARRGTAVHKFMELLDFTAFKDEKDIAGKLEAEKKRILADHEMEEEDMKLVHLPKIKAFLVSELGKRMIAAAAEGKLYRERRFSIGIPAKKIYREDTGFSEDDYILVQGIIDAYFEEDGALVLMDYKTDRAEGQTLLDRYRSQLICYGETLERLHKKQVKEQLIYGFFTGETIPVEGGSYGGTL